MTISEEMALELRTLVTTSNYFKELLLIGDIFLKIKSFKKMDRK